MCNSIIDGWVYVIGLFNFKLDYETRIVEYHMILELYKYD